MKGYIFRTMGGKVLATKKVSKKKAEPYPDKKSKAKKKKGKEGGKPRAPPAYALFLRDYRGSDETKRRVEELAKENGREPESNDYMRVVGKMWRSATKKMKAPYEEESRKIKEKINKEYEEKKSAEIKKPKPAYIFFFKEHHPRVVKRMGSDVDNKVVVKTIGADWNKLSDEDKQVYKEMAVKDKERYNREKEAKEKEDASKEEEKEEEEEEE